MRAGIIWVKLISLQGDGTYTVQEADAANNVKGPQIAGVKISAPMGGTPTVPSTKPYPCYYDHAGNLVFFFNRSIYDVQTFFLYSPPQAVDSASPDTHYGDGRIGFDTLAGWYRRTFLKFKSPVLCQTGNFSCCLPAVQPSAQSTDHTIINNGAYAFIVEVYMIAVDFDVLAVTWNNQPAAVFPSVPVWASGNTVNGAGTGQIRIDLTSGSPASGPAGYGIIKSNLGSNFLVYGIRVGLIEAPTHLTNMAGQLKAPLDQHVGVGW